VTSSEIVLEDCDDFKALEHNGMMKENGKSREEKKKLFVFFFSFACCPFIHVPLFLAHKQFYILQSGTTDKISKGFIL
jgi:hypothetical protein